MLSSFFHRTKFILLKINFVDLPKYVQIVEAITNTKTYFINFIIVS